MLIFEVSIRVITLLIFKLSYKNNIKMVEINQDVHMDEEEPMEVDEESKSEPVQKLAID